MTLLAHLIRVHCNMSGCRSAFYRSLRDSPLLLCLRNATAVAKDAENEPSRTQ